MKRVPPTSPGPLRTEVQPTNRAAAIAPTLRQDPSPPEAMLWARIKHTRTLGYPFRRQHPLGPYIADFYCHAAAFVVEIDGKYHLQRTAQDHARDTWMAANGLMVLRLTTIEVGSNPEGAASTCLRIARERFLAKGGQLSPPPRS